LHTLSETERRQRAVARWLLLGVAMIIIQILLGGVTRLTGSGLSITEWKPIMGAVPPLNEHDWQIAFEKYQRIAQYRYLNAHFTLTDFKHIFFWEWIHREWARIGLALVFIIGFVYFLVRGYFNREMIGPFIVLFILGGLQGAVGWIMVQSGLNDTDLYVNHIRLAIHFMAALLLLCYTLWFALKLLVPDEERTANTSLRNFTLAVIVLLSVQLVYGAFMAGLKAASAAPTWPTINGVWVPGDVYHYGGRSYDGLSAWISQPLIVHFIHRTLAYILFLLVIAWAIAAGKATSPRLRRWRWWPVVLVCGQVLLGVFTVLNGAHTVTAGHFGQFELLAEAHQLVAMCLLVAMVANLYLLRAAPAAG
jgi:cytochrome c oxidase assembly protein subunit 15